MYDTTMTTDMTLFATLIHFRLKIVRLDSYVSFNCIDACLSKNKKVNSRCDRLDAPLLRCHDWSSAPSETGCGKSEGTVIIQSYGGINIINLMTITREKMDAILNSNQY